MKHILLIGFKHVGKSSIGRALADSLGLAYRDLDRALEDAYAASHLERLSAREIMERDGEASFRALEGSVLREVLDVPEPLVISLGGGAALAQNNHALLLGHTVIHVTAPKAMVYERMMVNGRPAFFARDKNPFEEFERMWRERESIYERLATVTIHNDRSIEQAVRTLGVRFAPPPV